MSKAPFEWIGSKSYMSDLIISFMPPHRYYVEPFFGSGAVFFSKMQSDLETINDKNLFVYTFFQQMRDNYDELERLIYWTAYCDRTYKECLVIYKNPAEYTPVKLAWALFVLTNCGFSGKIDTAICCTKQLLYTRTHYGISKKKERLSALKGRFDKVQILNKDALDVIAKFGNSKDAFIYCDPPYINTEMGQYAGYSESDYSNLLSLLLSTPAKFMLSSYKNDLLDKMIADNPSLIVATKNKGFGLIKNGKSSDLLVMNYEIKNNLF